MKNEIKFPTFNPSAGRAIEIVKHELDDPCVPIETRTAAIKRVAGMATHNSVSKDELVGALRWIFRHYDFTEE